MCSPCKAFSHLFICLGSKCAIGIILALGIGIALVLFIVLGNGIALTAEPVSMLVLVELFSLSDKLRIAFNELGMAFLKFDNGRKT